MSSEGLGKDFRVRRRADFTGAYAQGKKVVVRPFVLFARTNETGACRIGITATRKIGNAVVRNRAKRVVREAFRRVRMDLVPGYDYVVVVRPKLLELKPEQIAPLLLQAARRATERDE